MMIWVHMHVIIVAEQNGCWQAGWLDCVSQKIPTCKLAMTGKTIPKLDINKLLELKDILNVNAAVAASSCL